MYLCLIFQFNFNFNIETNVKKKNVISWNLTFSIYATENIGIYYYYYCYYYSNKLPSIINGVYAQSTINVHVQQTPHVTRYTIDVQRPYYLYVSI